jgi:Zn/Cd-binding protein ZinT
MENWKMQYPYTLDENLSEAIQKAIKADDKATAKKLWDIFVSYRKTNKK